MHFCTFSLANTPQIKLLLKQVQLYSSILIVKGFHPTPQKKQPQKSVSVVLEGKILTAALAKTD